MDEREYELRRAELRHARISTMLTVLVAVLVAAISNVVVFRLSMRSLDQAATQFRASSDMSTRSLEQTAAHFESSSRWQEYNSIVQGLTSSSSAVQINSIRRLSRFVTDNENFSDVDEQQAEVRTAIQTLVAFVKERAASTSNGLQSWHSPQPPAVGPAITQLVGLVNNRELGTHSVDLAQVDMHGLTNLNGFRPGSGLFMVGADLRRALLTNLDLTEANADLRRSFLTCADLSDSRLGSANLQYADLSGANLSGADLLEVRNLTTAQLTGATVDSETRLPPGVPAPVAAAWSADDCARYAVAMKGLRSGAGYDPDTPCPRTAEDLMNAPPELQQASEDTALVEVCMARSP